MTSAKSVIFTAIKFKGVEAVRENATELSQDLFCSEQYVLKLCRDVETKKVTLV